MKDCFHSFASLLRDIVILGDDFKLMAAMGAGNTQFPFIFGYSHAAFTRSTGNHAIIQQRLDPVSVKSHHHFAANKKSGYTCGPKFRKFGVIQLICVDISYFIKKSTLRKKRFRLLTVGSCLT